MNLSQNNQNTQVNLDLSKAKTIECENPECDSIVFRPVNILKEVSGVMIGQPRNQIVSFGILQCAECKVYQTSDLENIPDVLQKINELNARRT